MGMAREALLRSLDWLLRAGLTERDLYNLNPCVPGEFTMPGALYVNTGSPDVFYVGTNEGTLPMVRGRWYLIPVDLVRTHPQLASDVHSVARARTLIR